RLLELDDPSARPVGQQVEQAVASLLHVANALVQLAEIAILARRATVLYLEAHQSARTKRADEEVAFPFLEDIAGVKHGARGRDHRIPVIHRLLHAFLCGALADFLARVVDAVGDDWPAVIASGLRVVE